MNGSSSEHPDVPPRGSRFATTRWSLVLASGRQETDGGREALAELCETYWYPIYVYVRRRGRQPAEAQDLTQEFFARLLAGDALRTADRQRGRFRSYLLTMLQRFLIDQQRRQGTLKRGGNQPPLSLDFEQAERRIASEPWHDWTAEREFDRRWTVSLLERVLLSLRQDYARRGKEQLFDRLRNGITADGNLPAYEELAAALHMSPAAVKVAVHRLRQRYRERLRAEVAQTVADASEIDDELAQLLASVRGS